MAILSEAQIKIVRDQIVADGGELLGVDQETKGDKILSRLCRINSKVVDGRNILTVDPS